MNNDAIRQFVRRELRAVTLGVATAIGIGGGLPAAMANPIGGTVVSGQGSITSPNAATTLINQQSNQLTLNWSSFNVASGETVKFVQPSSSSVALNNILSQSPSQIFGEIDANGRVVLVNPNGILFGRTAQLNVGSLIASSLELKQYDPATGTLSFQSLSGHPGVIDNEGTITAAHGGSVALLGGTVLNNGLVVADYGTVAMGAGQVATLDFYGGGLLRLQVGGDVTTNTGGAPAAVQNGGRIQADGGQVLLTAAATQDVFSSAVNNTGVIRANRIQNVGGVIELSGPDGVVANSGTLDASGKGGSSTGGTVQVVGHDVGLFGNSVIDVSGAAGGGTALVGGGFHGSNPNVEDASQTYVGADATIDADATASGTGGKVAVWSNDGTQYYGSISARGAGQGSGGYAEVSGKGYLDYQGQADLRAPAGKTGTLLLDPTEITIEDGASGTDTAITVTGSGPFADTSSGAGSILMDGTINGQLDTANVTVTTSTGDIVISNAAGPVTLGPTTANGDTLTLNSAASISWNAGWSYTNDGQLTLYAANGSIGANATGEAIALGGSPLLMQATAGIGSASVPVETTGLTTLAAGGGSAGVYISNSGSGSVTVSSLTNPVTTTAVAGLSAAGAISLVDSAGAITLSQAVAAGSADVTLNASGAISESGAGLISTTGGLTTSSVGGTSLGGANAVAGFNATNSGSGDVSLTNGAVLAVSGISQSGGGSVTVRNAGGTTLSGAVNGGTGSVMLQDTSAVLALGANNVSGVGVTLEGVGVTQSAASIVNAGSGDILVNGGGAAVSMAGALTTTSNTATAVKVLDATTVALPAITTGAGGTTTIGAGDISAAVTQSGATAISTGTLTGDTTGPVTLGNGNTIATVGAFTSDGFDLDDGSLSIAGALAGGAGNVLLTSTGTISESGGGLVSTTGTLRTTSVGGTSLGGANAVAGFNATNSGSGDVSLTNGAVLAVSGISQSGGGSVTVRNAGGTTLSGAVNGGTGSVMLQDTSAVLALGANNVSGVGVTLEGVGVTQSAASIVNAGSGDILVNGGGAAVSMAGALTTTSNTATAVKVLDATTVALPAITTGAGGTTTIGAGDISAAVTQSGATVISTGTLTGDTTGPVTLGNGNTIATVGAFTSDGFDLDDGSLSIAGALAGGAGNVLLTSTGTISETGGGLVSTTGTLHTSSVGGTSLGGANLVSTFAATNSGTGSVSLSDTAATTLTITGLSQTGGGLVSVTSSGAIVLAGTNSANGGLALTSSGGAVTLGSAGADNLTVSGGPLSVTSDGSIIEQGGSSVTASSTQLTLDSPAGDVILKNAAGMGAITLAGVGRDLDLESTTQAQINSLLTGKTWASVTVVDNSAAITLPNFDATAALDVTAPGISQSAGPVVVGGATTLNASGDAISLNDATNSFGGNVAFTGSTVALASAGALSSSGTATGNLSETSGGPITQGGALVVSGTSTLSSTGDITLSNAANAFTGGLALSGGNVTVANTTATTIAGASATGSLTLDSGGAVGQAGALVVAGATTIDAGTNDVTLSDAANALTGPVTLTGGAVTLANSDATTLAGVNSVGSLTLDAGGAVSESGTLIVSGTSNIDAGGNAITLGSAGNSFGGNVAFTGSTVALASAGALSSSGTATGNLSETSGGPITQGGALVVSGTSTLSSTGDITLSNAANAFTGGLALSGGNVTVANTTATTIAGASATGSLTLDSGGAIGQAGALVVAGATTIDAGTNDVMLSDAANALTGPVTLTGGAVTLANSDATTLAGVNSVGSLTLDAGGAVSETGTLSVTTTTSINAGTNDVTLVQANSFGGNVAFSGNNVSLATGSGDLMSSGSASGNLTETSAAAITQGGVLKISGKSTLTADGGTGDITLANAGNAFTGAVTLLGGAVTLANTAPTTLAGADKAADLTLDAGGAVTFGAVGTDVTTVTNDLIVQGLNGSGAAGGAVTETGTLSVGGTTSIDAGGSDIDLNRANTFGGAVTFTGGNVALTDGAGSLTTSGTASGTLTEVAEGPSSDLNVGDLGAAGNVLLIAGDSILGTSSQATVTANNVEVRYGLQNGSGQLGSANASQQIGFEAASGASRVQLTIWLPAPGTQFENQDLRQTASDLSITRHPFVAGDQQILYMAPFGVSPGQVAGTLGAIQTTLQGTTTQTAGIAQGAATQGTQSVLYIDWGSYNPNVSLFGTLNPAVCLPADQRDDSAGSGSGCAAASASVLRSPTPILVAMVPTREGWKAMPLFDLTQ